MAPEKLELVVEVVVSCILVLVVEAVAQEKEVDKAFHILELVEEVTSYELAQVVEVMEEAASCIWALAVEVASCILALAMEMVVHTLVLVEEGAYGIWALVADVARSILVVDLVDHRLEVEMGLCMVAHLVEFVVYRLVGVGDERLEDQLLVQGM